MRGNRIAQEIALTREEIARSREEIVKSRDTTERLFAEQDRRNAEGREATNKLLAEQDQRNEDMRLFMREERLRANKVLEPLIRSHDQLISEVRDQREEMTAQREGFFALIAQLKKGGRIGDA